MNDFKSGDVVFHKATFQYLIVLARKNIKPSEESELIVDAPVYMCRGVNSKTGDYNFYEMFGFELEYVGKEMKDAQEDVKELPKGKKGNVN